MEFNHQCGECNRWFRHTNCGGSKRLDYGTPCKQCAEGDSTWEQYMGDIVYKVDPFVKWVEDIRNEQ